MRERAKKYGDPKFNFRRIAKLWSIYLQKELDERDVALCMILAKIARDVHERYQDNLDDIVGYLVAHDRAAHPQLYEQDWQPGTFIEVPTKDLHAEQQCEVCGGNFQIKTGLWSRHCPKCNDAIAKSIEESVCRMS